MEGDLQMKKLTLPAAAGGPGVVVRLSRSTHHNSFYDLRLKLGSVCMVVGPSQSGKTCFVNNLIRHCKSLFDPIPKQIYWCYGEIPPCEKFSNVIYKKGLPDEDFKFDQSFVVLDDLFLEASNSNFVTNLFSRVAHHRQSFICYITQNLFHQSKHNRTRMLNAQYLVLFRNIRDRTIVRTLSQQIYQDNRFLPDVVADISRDNPYGYLFLDLRPETSDEIRVRTGIFFEEEVRTLCVYKQTDEESDST